MAIEAIIPRRDRAPRCSKPASQSATVGWFSHHKISAAWQCREPHGVRRMSQTGRFFKPILEVLRSLKFCHVFQ